MPNGPPRHRLDLKDVDLIDRDVFRFFVRCDADGVKGENRA
jgi:hypothetical protein